MRLRKRSPYLSMLFSTRRMSMRSEPRPMIMRPRPWGHKGYEEPAGVSFRGNALRIACLVHQRPHVSDRILKAHEDRFADQKVANVEFADLRYRRDRFHVVERQAVAGMDFKSERRSVGGTFAEFVQEMLALRAHGIAVRAGMKFDDG